MESGEPGDEASPTVEEETSEELRRISFTTYMGGSIMHE